MFKQNKVNGQKIFLHRLCTSYSAYFIKKYKHAGHVFQGVYKSKAVLEDSYLTQLTGYIHLNPPKPFSWKYSSLSVYLGQIDDNLVKPRMFLEMHKLTFKKYANFLEKNYQPGNLSSADLLFDDED